MKEYVLIYSNSFRKELKKIDVYERQLILKWLEKHIQHTRDPRLKGKGLKGNLSGYWRYRVGNYRVLVKIIDKELLVLALEVGHRRQIYK